MTRKHITARCAPVAIAAILALGPTGVAAQAPIAPSSAPAPAPAPIEAPVLQSPVAPAPVQPSPEPTTEPTTAPATAPTTAPAPARTTAPRFVSQPRVQPVEEQAPAEAQPAVPTTAMVPDSEPRRAAASAAPASTARTPGAAPGPAADNAGTAAPAPRGVSSASQGITDSGDTTSVPAPPVFDPTAPLASDAALPREAEDTAVESGTVGLIAAALAGLIPIGLAIFAVVWWRRRSRPAFVAPRPTITPAAAATGEPPRTHHTGHSATKAPNVADATLAPSPLGERGAAMPLAGVTAGRRPQTRTSSEAAGQVLVAERPAAMDRPVPAERYSEVEVPSDDVRSTPRSIGQAITPPRTAPTDPAERRALIERMVDAAPDEANPFTSRKARTRRARLILASLGRNAGTAGHGSAVS